MGSYKGIECLVALYHIISLSFNVQRWALKEWGGGNGAEDNNERCLFVGATRLRVVYTVL
jgi:hypothetical protein